MWSIYLTCQVIRSCTANCPPASALFMDELAATILRDGKDTEICFLAISVIRIMNIIAKLMILSIFSL